MHGRNNNANAVPNIFTFMLVLQESGLTLNQYLEISSGVEPGRGANRLNPGQAWQHSPVEANEEDEIAADWNEEDAFDPLPLSFLLARLPLPVQQPPREANLNAGIQASFHYQQPQAAAAVITDDDIVRRVIPYLITELSSDEMGVFKENFNKLGLDSRLELVQYLLKKYANAPGFKQDSRWEKKIEELDDSQVFGSIEGAIKKAAGKPAAEVSQAHIDQVRVALLSTLKEMERALLLLKNPQQQAPSKASSSSVSTGIFSRCVNPVRGGSPLPESRFMVLTQGLAHLNGEEQKSTFLENLSDYLKVNPQLSRSDLLDLFGKLRKPKGDFEFIHQQNNPKWDRFRLLFKSNRNGPEEANFWHTKTFQAAVKILKEAYLHLPDELEPGRKEDEKYFIDYVRGNAPVHHSQTDTRKLFSL